MDTQTETRFRGLTEREKQTLRLMVRGHDAKSIARSLGLSVHTVNERLRDARRKMEVSSSREAARLLYEAEAGRTPDFLGDMKIGADSRPEATDQGRAPGAGAGRMTLPWLLIGGMTMTILIGLLALASFNQTAATRPPAPVAAEAEPTAVAAQARQWLELLDAGRWADSYQGTGAAFRKLNTLQVWTEVSERVRPPLGAVVSRTLLGQEFLPAPPAGYEVVKFSTRYANRDEPMVETVTLEREGSGWVVVGVTVG